MMTILRNSLSATVLIIVIVLVRAAALQKLPKNTFCVLWIGAALRLLLPASIESEYSFFTFLNGLLRKSGGDMGPIADVIRPEETQGQMGNANGGMIPILEVLWLTGVCVMTVFFLISFIRSMRKFRRSTPVDGEYRDYLPVKRLFPVKIRQSEEITGPLTYGFFRPVILLPRATDWEDQEKLSCVLAHECAHIRRHDCLAKLLFVAALCAHWFNPAVWILCLLANRDIELACDEKTMRFLGEDSRFSYARTLLCQAEEASGFLPLFSHFGKHGIAERVTAALKPRRRSVWCTVAACLLVLGILTFFGTGPARNPEAEAAVPESTSGDSPRKERIFPDQPWRGIAYRCSDPAVTWDELNLTTPEGEPYPLKSGQSFNYWLNDEALEQGFVTGYVEESTPEGELLFPTKASAPFCLISQDPLVYMIGDATIYSNGMVK